MVISIHVEYCGSVDPARVLLARGALDVFTSTVVIGKHLTYLCS